MAELEEAENDIATGNLLPLNRYAPFSLDPRRGGSTDSSQRNALGHWRSLLPLTAVRRNEAADELVERRTGMAFSEIWGSS